MALTFLEFLDHSAGIRWDWTLSTPSPRQLLPPDEVLYARLAAGVFPNCHWGVYI